MPRTAHQIALAQALDDAYANLNHIAEELLSALVPTDEEVEGAVASLGEAKPHELWDELGPGLQAACIYKMRKDEDEDEDEEVEHEPTR